MGIYDKVQSKVSAAFNTKLSDAVKSANFKSISRVPNTSTGGTAETVTSYSTRGVFSPFTSQEITASQGAILNTDTKCLILDSELLVTPKIDDELTLNSKTLQLVDFSKDPAGAMYVIQFRGK